MRMLFGSSRAQRNPNSVETAPAEKGVRCALPAVNRRIERPSNHVSPDHREMAAMLRVFPGGATLVDVLVGRVNGRKLKTKGKLKYEEY